MCTCFWVREAQGWSWGLEGAPGHLWVVLLGISMTLKSVRDTCGVSSQLWGVALSWVCRFIDRCYIWAGGKVFLQGAARLSAGQGGVGAAPQSTPAGWGLCQPKIAALCSCVAAEPAQLRAAGGSDRTKGTRSAGALLPQLCLWKWVWSRRLPGQGPCQLPGQSRAVPHCAGAAFELQVLCSALEPLSWQEPGQQSQRVGTWGLGLDFPPPAHPLGFGHPHLGRGAS